MVHRRGAALKTWGCILGLPFIMNEYLNEKDKHRGSPLWFLIWLAGKPNQTASRQAFAHLEEKGQTGRTSNCRNTSSPSGGGAKKRWAAFFDSHCHAHLHPKLAKGAYHSTDLEVPLIANMMLGTGREVQASMASAALRVAVLLE